jgi:hypothetical protein
MAMALNILDLATFLTTFPIPLTTFLSPRPIFLTTLLIVFHLLALLSAITQSNNPLLVVMDV